MADKNDDIKHLFEHLGLDPTDYQEIKGPTKVVESARRWSLLGEVSEHPPRAAEIPEERRQVVAQLSAANRAQRIATIRNEEAAQRPASDRAPEPAEDRGEVDALRRSPSPGRLPPTVTWATDDQDVEDITAASESVVAPGFDGEPAADHESDQKTEKLTEVDDAAAPEPTAPGQADDDASASEAGQQTHVRAGPEEREPDEVGADVAKLAARRAEEDAEEAAAARAVREAAEARASRKRQAADAERMANDEPAADINLLGDFAESIGAPPEPVNVASARDAEPRRKPQPAAAPSRASSRSVEQQRREAPAEERSDSGQTKSKTGAAIQGLLAATKKVKPTPTVSRPQSRAAEDPPSPSRSAAAQGRDDHQESRRSSRQPEPSAPNRAESRQAPVADAPSQERRQHGREDFESAIEAVAQAAKAEVRRRVEDERKQSAVREARPEEAPGGEPTDTTVEAPVAAMVAEPRPDRVVQEDTSESERIAASAAPTEPTPAPQQDTSRVARPRHDAEPSVGKAGQSDRSAAATSSRHSESRDAEASAPRERALPASGRAGPSPLRKLREAQAAEGSHDEAGSEDEHAARKGRLSETFRRLQTPEKPAISASGKLRLNYGVRGGAQGVRTAQPETINEVFDRLRRNRRPGEPRK